MTSQDEYSPEVKPYQRTNRTDSHGVHYQTVQEDSLYAILSRLKVKYLAKEPIRIFDESSAMDGRALSIIPDALIIDGPFGQGVFEVDGGIHKTRGNRRWDEQKDIYYVQKGYWVERLSNKDAKKESKVREALERHKREVSELP